MRVLFTVFCLLGATPLAAQGWTTEITRDEVYDAGRVFLPGHMINITCAAPTGRASVTPDSRWWEVSVAPANQYLIWFNDQMVPVAPHEVQVEMTLFVDQTGYRLPTVLRNELEDGWQVMLSTSDPLFEAGARASRLVLQVGSATAWDLPLDGLASGLEQVRSVCDATWRGGGGAVAMSDLTVVAKQAAAGVCAGTVTIGQWGLKTANIDGDGIDDVILDYNDITCGPDQRRPNVCGANTCSVDVFLSRTYAQTGRPENLLGTSASIVSLSNGNAAVSASGNLGMCQGTTPCAFLFYWDGVKFTDLPN